MYLLFFKYMFDYYIFICKVFPLFVNRQKEEKYYEKNYVFVCCYDRDDWL